MAVRRRAAVRQALGSLQRPGTQPSWRYDSVATGQHARAGATRRAGGRLRASPPAQRPDEDCVGLRMLWPCATGRVHTHSVSQHSVRELRVMRTRVCDALCIDLPPIPHPQSPEYSDVSMAHALKQLCGRALRPCRYSRDARNRTQTGPRGEVALEAAVPGRARRCPAAAAISVPGGGDDESDTSGVVGAGSERHPCTGWRPCFDAAAP